MQMSIVFERKNKNCVGCVVWMMKRWLTVIGRLWQQWSAEICRNPGNLLLQHIPDCRVIFLPHISGNSCNLLQISGNSLIAADQTLQLSATFLPNQIYTIEAILVKTSALTTCFKNGEFWQHLLTPDCTKCYLSVKISQRNFLLVWREKPKQLLPHVISGHVNSLTLRTVLESNAGGNLRQIHPILHKTIIAIQPPCLQT